MNIIDKVDFFKQKQIQSMFDQELIREYKEKFDIDLSQPVECLIVFSDKMWAFLPERE